jgi:hypothetical protein
MDDEDLEYSSLVPTCSIGRGNTALADALVAIMDDDASKLVRTRKK